MSRAAARTPGAWPAATPSVAAAPGDALRGPRPAWIARNPAAERTVAITDLAARTARPLTRPPKPRDRFGVWLLLAALLAVATPALIVELHRPDAVDRLEAVSLDTLSQTRQHLQKLGGPTTLTPEAWVPYRGGPRWGAFPGTAWTQLVLLSPWRGATLTATQLTAMARGTAVAMGLLTLVAVYWAGLSIGGTRTGLFAGLLCAGNPFMVLQARTAAPPAYYAAWIALAVAAALWALRPHRPSPSIVRQGLGWGLCGLAMAMAVFTAGPGGLFAAAAPILLVAILCPHRLSHLLGLVAAGLLAVLLVLPWAIGAHGQDPAAWPLDAAQWVPLHWKNPGRFADAAGGRALAVPLVLLPWTFWFIGALVQPLSTSSAGVRARMFLGWMWLVPSLAVFLLAGGAEADQARAARQSCLAALIPAAAVVLAQLFHQYADLADGSRFARSWRLLRWSHVAALALASAAVVWALGAQPALVARGWLTHPVFENLGWAYAAGVGVVLVGIAALSVRWVVRNFPDKSLMAWSLWGLACNLALVVPLAHGPLAVNPARGDGEKLAAVTGGDPVFWLRPALGRDAAPGEADPLAPAVRFAADPRPMPPLDADAPDPALAFYAGKPFPPIDEAQLELLRGERGRFFLLAADGEPPDGLRLVARLPSAGLALWRHAP